MKRLKHFRWIFLIAQLSACLAVAKEAYGLDPYVHSDLDGRFYARCIPAGDSGDKGTTTIFRVRRTDDERFDTYDWYNRNGVVLGWSPIAGKVAVWRLRQEDDSLIPVANRIEFSFYLGGKLLKSFTTQDLLDRGAKVQEKTSSANRIGMDYRALGCQQVPWTNDYYFGIELTNGKKIRFDILTGVEYTKRIVNKREEKVVDGLKTITWFDEENEQVASGVYKDEKPWEGSFWIEQAIKHFHNGEATK